MPQVISAVDMRVLEQEAVDRGTSYATLMHTAGTKAAKRFASWYCPEACRTVLVLCGNGNNGGDGFVIAKQLTEEGYAVHVVLTDGEPKTELAKQTFRLMEDSGVPVCRVNTVEEVAALFDLYSARSISHVIDAVYGIGFRGRLRLHLCALFDAVTASGACVTAVDIPSGLHADSGFADAHTLCASRTITFTAAKPALVMPSCNTYVGEVTVEDVGIDRVLCEAKTTVFSEIDEALVRSTFLPRPADGHKGTFGRALSVCGSYGMVGAALLSGKAALRCGVGLMHMALPRSVYPIAAGALWEAVYHPLGETNTGAISPTEIHALCALVEQKQAVLIGCGLSHTAQTEEWVQALLPRIFAPIILDADGLNCICAHMDILKAITAPLVITPHPAEAARLLRVSVDTIERDRIGAVKQLATLTGAVCVLKGHRTLVADPDGTVYVNRTGCVGMATGGSGDVLAGMIVSFAAQGMSVLSAALVGVYLHGAAGEAASSRLGQTAMLPTDMLEELPTLLSHFERRE